ncbi:hypothetical protein HCG49_01525 [Arenibacter sp. 6A1]|uniref:hypothetical protein n=1 Tax=Arenibacter sp. 6A1 TaxID=2720391 RepID=UPI0014475E40|nr:hypothetical protein [Arenibacter sp. 6A1]NKI25239.1 hypothetical protein [Arenibacter sp. 6A1]
MNKSQLILFLAIIFCFCSCSKKEDLVPEKVLQFSEKAIDASINSHPQKDFTNTYFHYSVTDEYRNKFKLNSIIWRDSDHTISLREAKLINTYKENTEYLLKFWVTFKDNRKFSYLLQVLEEGDKMALKRFEPLNADIANSFYSPSSKFDIPDFDSNKRQMYLAYILISITLFIVIFLAVWNKKYRLLLLSIPLIFIYEQGMSIFHYEGIKIISPKTHYGLPTYENIDLYFTSISLLTTGVFYAWLIIVLFLLRRYIVHKLSLNKPVIK